MSSLGTFASCLRSSKHLEQNGKLRSVCWCPQLSCSDRSFTPGEEMTEHPLFTRTVPLSGWRGHQPSERKEPRLGYWATAPGWQFWRATVYKRGH